MTCTLCEKVKSTKRLKILRILLNFKQQVLADFLGININTLQKWENREMRLTDKYRDKLRYVGINAQWIDYGTGDPLSLDKQTVVKNILQSFK